MQQLFYQSCISGDVSQIRELLTPPVMEALQPPLQNPTLSYSVLLYNYGIQIACNFHHTDVVRLLLEYEPMRPYVDIAMSNHCAMRTVCREGYADIVRLILHHHPLQNLTHFITLARQHNHTEIVRILHTPVLYTSFISEVCFTDKVTTGIQLLSYQDILLPLQREHVITYMTAYLMRIISLPKDMVRYICTF
jgi:hypothetical protein